MARIETSAQKSQRKVMLVLLLTLVYLIVEIAGSVLAHSLAILADASHMFADFTILGMTLIAIRISKRPADRKRTYGYQRAEVIVVFVSSLIMLLVAAYIFYEAYLRFVSPPARVNPALMLAIGAAGLLVNLINMRMMRSSAKQSIGARGIYLEALMDGLSTLGVIAAAVIILLTNMYAVDTVFSVAIGVLIILRVLELMKDSSHILMEGTPRNISVGEVERELRRIRGVRRVHDMHIWTLTSNVNAISAHIIVARGHNNKRTLESICGMLRDRFGLAHSTIQLEAERMKGEFTH